MVPFQIAGHIYSLIYYISLWCGWEWGREEESAINTDSLWYVCSAMYAFNFMCAGYCKACTSPVLPDILDPRKAHCAPHWCFQWSVAAHRYWSRSRCHFRRQCLPPLSHCRLSQFRYPCLRLQWGNSGHWRWLQVVHVWIISTNGIMNITYTRNYNVRWIWF